MRPLKFTIFFFLLLSIISTLQGQSSSGDELEVRLFIVGQDDPIYSFWGHTGLAIKDPGQNRDIFFDFGNFNFESENFFTGFAMGRLLYIAYAANTEAYIRHVIRNERNITEYVLNLPAEAKLNMYRALIHKSRPENRTYLYHHYNDNCSTRIRDYIDEAVDGQIKTETEKVIRTSFRDSFLRFTNHSKLSGSFLSLLQGTTIDRPVSQWQEMYLPDVLEEVVKDFTYTNPQGMEVPLVKEVNILNVAPHRPEIPREYNSPVLWALIIGLLLGALALFFDFLTIRDKRTPFALLNILSGLILGILGCAILFLMAFTDHTYAYSNLNLFMINPLALFTVPAAILYWRKGDAWKARIHIFWRVQLGATLIMILIKVFTPAAQNNLVEILTILPLMLALSIKPGRRLLG